MKKYLPKEMLDLLRNLHSIEVDVDGSVDIYWKDNPREPFCASEFNPGTFTRDLIELLEKHVAVPNEDTRSSNPRLD